MKTPDAADLDAIVAALARIRGRRRGRPDGPPLDHHDPRHGRPGTPHGPHGGPHGWGDRFAGGPARVRLLDALAGADRALSITEIGEAIGVDQPRASRLVQQCVEADLVRREPDPTDARRTRVALTDTGRRFIEGMRGQRREQLQGALTDFTPAERADLARLLTKLADAWPSA